MTLRELKQQTLEAFRPPTWKSVSEWANENRMLVSESSSTTGRWRTERAEYQRKPMDAFTEPGIWKIVIMAGSQVGKTEIELNCMGRAIDLDPGPMLYVQPSVDTGNDFSKRRIAPMIRSTKVLSEKVYEAKVRDTSNTISMKTFPGGSVAITGANSPAELASRPVRYLFMDEIDRFPESAGSEGNPIRLAEERTTTFYNRKIVLASTPTIKGKSKIEREYLRGTQEEWHICCPKCESYSFIRFTDIQFDKIDYEKGGETLHRVKSVKWRCPNCKLDSTEYEVKRSDGKWVQNNPDAVQDGIRSFRLNVFMSPWANWKDVIKKFLNAKDDPEDLKVFYNTQLGETWELRGKRSEPEAIFQRREHYDAEVPTGTLVLTLGVDTQDNRLEYEVVGWGRDEESWGISRGVIMGRADAPGAWEEIDELLEREWKLKNGRSLRIAAGFMDSGGHFTQDVYRGCWARTSRKLFPIKGEGGENKAYVRLSKTSGKPLFLIGVNSGKEAIMHATTIENAGARFMHFPLKQSCGYDMEFCKGLLSEHVVFRRSGGKNILEWKKDYARNEALDCRNYARAVFKYFNWDLDALEKRLYADAKAQLPGAMQRKRKRVLSQGIE